MLSSVGLPRLSPSTSSTALAIAILMARSVFPDAEAVAAVKLVATEDFSVARFFP